MKKFLIIKSLKLPGSQITPAWLATISPNDRDIAKPGISSSASQTL